MKLKDLRELYLDEEFIIGYNEHVLIVPKKVKIKEDLTVWYNGGCIINGMKDRDFKHHPNSVEALIKEMNIHKDLLKPKSKKLL